MQAHIHKQLICNHKVENCTLISVLIDASQIAE